MYWALEDARAVEWALGQPVAYHHVTRDANYITANPVTCCAFSLWQTLGGCEGALLGWAMPPLDDWPCIWYSQDYDSHSMMLCNWCNHCY